MALLTVDQIREHVETGLSDDALTRTMNAEEAYIIQMAGPNDGSLTVTVDGGSWTAWLPKPASSITSIHEYYTNSANMTEVTQYNVINGGRGIRKFTTAWERYVEVEYTPVSDDMLRMQALIELVQLAVQDEGLASSIDDTYQTVSYDRAMQRRKIIEPLRHRYAGVALA